MVDGYHFIPKVFSTDSYRYVFSGAASVAQAYVVTIVVTVMGTALHLLITAMLAYALRSDLERKDITICLHTGLVQWRPGAPVYVNDQIPAFEKYHMGIDINQSGIGCKCSDYEKLFQINSQFTH